LNDHKFGGIEHLSFIQILVIGKKIAGKKLAKMKGITNLVICNPLSFLGEHIGVLTAFAVR